MKFIVRMIDVYIFCIAVAAKIAGESAMPGQVFASGTALDSGRFRKLIAASLNLDSRSVEGFIVGEHGDSSVAGEKKA